MPSHNHLLAAPEFSNVECYRVELSAPLLILKATGGVLACGYLDVATMNKLDEAGAIVTGVRDFQEMLDAYVVAVSKRAHSLGVAEGSTGKEALRILNKKSA